MRILHVMPSFGLGGMEKIVCTLVNHTSDCYTHEILALDNRTEASNWITDKKIRLVDFNKPDKRGQFFWKLHRVLQKTKPDLLMTYNWGATDAIWLGRLLGIRRLIHSEHGFNVDEGETTQWKRDVLRFLVYRCASRLIVVSRELETLLKQSYFLKQGHVARIANGIDASFYSPDSMERQRMRKILGFKDSDVVVGFCGRLDPIKNLFLLVDIFAYCVQQHSHLRLLIVGDGPERKRLEAFCEQRNLQSHIVFTGQQENVVSYLRAMDVFLLTSLREQMPITVLEAMGVGIPVVATNVGEIPSVIDNEINGFVLDLSAPMEAFAESLVGLLCPGRRKRIGEAARQKVIDHFQDEIMLERYKAVIREVMSE